MARGSKRSGNDKWTRRTTSDADLAPAPLELDEETDSTPFDLAAVQRDDALIDAISGEGQVVTETPEEYRLAMLLAGWRAEIVTPALPDEPSLDEVVAAVNEELAPGSGGTGRLRLLRPIAGAAAAIAVVMAGVTVFSYNAQPGDPLWKVKEVVFTERANSTVAGIDTTSNLQEAERLIKAGDTQAAMTVLQSASKRAGDVNDSDKRDELNAWHDRLMADVAKTTTPTTTTTTTPPGESTSVSAVPVVPGVTVPGLPSTTVPSVPSSESPGTPPVTPSVPSVTPTLPATPSEVPPTTEPSKPQSPAPTTTSAPAASTTVRTVPSVDTRPLVPATPS
ncbi:anti-sigma-D factor RsdA [Rhodococcus sp. NPDC127528]|uniref:anti-sigma-D factor RsdA n=1 Tax=unclassified Rhodococcus (in: high G+C Gram-positive bacteria) TaxID=192944 RepID=UPI0036453FDD